MKYSNNYSSLLTILGKVETKKPKLEKSDTAVKESLGGFVVTEKAMRPASIDKRCFYCHQKIGDVHKPDCVLIDRKVKIRLTVEYEVVVPAKWDKHQIEFQRNEGSWCADNAISELSKVFSNNGAPCMCDSAEFEYLGGDSEPYLSES